MRRQDMLPAPDGDVPVFCNGHRIFVVIQKEQIINPVFDGRIEERDSFGGEYPQPKNQADSAYADDAISVRNRISFSIDALHKVKCGPDFSLFLMLV
jgi:hypothetical protein